MNIHQQPTNVILRLLEAFKLNKTRNIYTPNLSLLTSPPVWVQSIAMSVSVCVSVSYIDSKTTCPNFNKCSLHVICGRGSVLL